MKKRKYGIVDIETTGGMFHRDKIIEVAIIVTDGVEILSEYQSLVHPERSIPGHITGITGINDHMVADAPKFYEIAKNIIEHLEGCIFVAHNVNFDYNFIKEEFRSLGYPFNKKKLCTVKLTRSTIPGLRSYGLDSLVNHFDIHVDSRHRAYDDTLATYKIFHYIVNELTDSYHLDKLINQGLDASVLPRGMDIDQVHDAPETPGVYYLSNQYDNVLYVGKAKDIKKRIFQHFRKITVKSNKIINHVHKLHYKETGSELIALLLELYEIKSLRPEFNKAMKRSNYPYALYLNPRVTSTKKNFIIGKNNKSNDFKYEKLKLFASKAGAVGFVQQAILEDELCAQTFTSRASKFLCSCEENCHAFSHDISNQIEAFIDKVKNEFEEDHIILLPGRSEDEQGFVMIHEKRFWGFGYIEKDEVISSREEWNDYVSYQFWYPEANGIIKTYCAKNRVKKISI